MTVLNRCRGAGRRAGRYAAVLVAASALSAGWPAIADTAAAGAKSAAYNDDGSFPTADQVGGDVFPDGLQPGEAFPMDVELFDPEAHKTDLGTVMGGKRSLLTFFITAAPVSIAELKKIEDFAKGKDINLIFANSDVVGNALFGGKDTVIDETVRTVQIIKDEEGLETVMYVAPNNVFNPDGLSNRLGFRGLPTSYLLAADGTVERVFVGPHDWTDADLTAGAAPTAATAPEVAPTAATAPDAGTPMAVDQTPAEDTAAPAAEGETKPEGGN